MKKSLIIVVMLLVSLVSVFALAGCTNGTFLEDGKLIVATNAAFEPFEFKDGEEFVGVDMDIAREIGKILGREVVISDMEFDSVVTSISGGTADIGMAGLTIRPDRLANVDFCDPYFAASQVVIAKEGSAFTTATTVDELSAMLKNKKIGAQNGTTGYYFAEDVEGATTTGYTSGALAVLDLINGTIDCVIIDTAPAQKLVENNAGLVALTTLPLTEEDYAFCVRKGNAELVTLINDALKTLKDNGKFDEIIAKYFG